MSIKTTEVSVYFAIYWCLLFMAVTWKHIGESIPENLERKHHIEKKDSIQISLLLLWWNILTKTNMGRKGLFNLYIRSQPITEGCQGRLLKQEPEGRNHGATLLVDSLSGSYLAFSVAQDHIHAHGMVLSTGIRPLYLNNHDNPTPKPQIYLQTNLIETQSRVFLCYPRLCQVVSSI